MYKSGEADATTRHGACPVLHGSKWGSLTHSCTMLHFNPTLSNIYSSSSNHFINNSSKIQIEIQENGIEVQVQEINIVTENNDIYYW